MAEAESQTIRTQFDDVLKSHIRRLLDSMPEAASLPFDLATITCLILLVERQSEIASFGDSSVEGYSEKILLEELTDIGLPLGDASRTAVENLSRMGFVSVDPEGIFVPRDSTPKLVAVLDNMFPGMPGLNLVAYTIQTMDEAISGRKDINQAISQFDQTLRSRGVPLSEQKPRSAAVQQAPAGQKKKTDPEAKNRKQTYLKRLSEIRSKSNRGTADAVNISPFAPTGKPKVVSLFPSKSAPGSSGIEETASDKADKDASDNTQPVTVAPVPQTDETETDKTPDSQEANDEPETATHDDISKEEPTETIADDIRTADETMVHAPDLSHDEASGDNSPIEKGPEEMYGEPITGNPPADAVDDDERIAQESAISEKIEKFEETLAMSCPACRIGKVRAATTEKNKRYYVCENHECGFISWGKPYHYSCPICQNPFLIEYSGPDGVSGLRCPKATCHYRQHHLDNPNLPSILPEADTAPEAACAAQPQSSSTPKKKRKKLVRKRYVRRKR